MKVKQDDILKKYIKKLKYLRYSESAINSYSNYVLIFLETTNKNYQHLTGSDFQVFLDDYNFSSASQQNGIISAIKLLYEKVLNKKYKKVDFTRPKKSTSLPIIHSQEEMQMLFNVCSNLKHKVIIALLYSCGLRISELLNLKWEDVDRSLKIIRIIKGKGNKDRPVMLDEKLIPLLESYARKYKTKKYVLKGQKTEKYSDTSVRQVLKQLSKKAGLNKRIYPHLLRHNCFTHMVENGIDINLIQTLAGHKRASTTRIYTHLSNNFISQIKSPLNNISFD
tara:strand:+ start:82 stop:921 length:840 start_codon:yes stop_codon:yes gene_type:complete